MQKKIAKFQVGDLLPIGMTIVVLGIGLAYGLKVMGDVSSDMTANSAEKNATTDTIAAVAQIPSNLGTIVSVIVAAVVIGILVTYLMVKFRN